MCSTINGTIQEDKISVGIIGMGDMGKMYARNIASAGWRVNACDRPDKYDALATEFAEVKNIHVYLNGHLVSRQSDYIIYSVEAELIDSVVAMFGPSTKIGAIVGGQTSCKAPEMAAFEKHLPSDVEIISCHSLHGPRVDPHGQPLVLVKHKASEKSLDLVTSILSCFNSKFVHLTAEEHDRITADTQAVTHAAFLSMGTAWTANNQFPWESTRWSGGIENVKINITLRIYSNKWHVYAGLAILNPSAAKQIRQYASSVTELFKLMVQGRYPELYKRIHTAREFVFGGQKEGELLLRDEVLDRFSLGSIPKGDRTPNSHLSLLAMVDCWHQCKIVPYDHMICSTPLFRLWLGAAEYLFCQPDLLDESIRFAVEDHSFRSDDLEFTFAARGWSEAVINGDFNAYRVRFQQPQGYFGPRFPDAIKLGNDMIKTISSRTIKSIHE